MELQLHGKCHYSDIAWAPWLLKSPAYKLFVQQFVQAEYMENETAVSHISGPLWRKSTGNQWIPFIKIQ